MNESYCCKVSPETATEDRIKTGGIDQDLRNPTTIDVDFGAQERIKPYFRVRHCAI